LFAEEAFWILDAALVQGLVRFEARDSGSLRELGRRWKDTLLVRHHFDRVLRHVDLCMYVQTSEGSTIASSMSDDQTARHDVACDPRLIRALCGKYEKLCDLRQRQQTDVAPRAELVALASAFPGALRELDCLPVEELERRAALLRAVLDDRAQVERWMVLQISYHGFMRAVLRIRRLLLVVQDGSESQSLAYTPALDEPELQRFDAEALAVIRKPPGGRLNPWVVTQVAKDHAVSEACIENALWRMQVRARP
jgi:hypothetical protein